MKFADMTEGTIVQRRHGTNYVPVLIFAGEDATSFDYVIGLNVDAWNHVRIDKRECHLWEQIGHLYDLPALSLFVRRAQGVA